MRVISVMKVILKLLVLLLPTNVKIIKLIELVFNGTFTYCFDTGNLYAKSRGKL